MHKNSLLFWARKVSKLPLIVVVVVVVVVANNSRLFLIVAYFWPLESSQQVGQTNSRGKLRKVASQLFECPLECPAEQVAVFVVVVVVVALMPTLHPQTQLADFAHFCRLAFLLKTNQLEHTKLSSVVAEKQAKGRETMMMMMMAIILIIN